MWHDEKATPGSSCYPVLLFLFIPTEISLVRNVEAARFFPGTRKGKSAGTRHYKCVRLVAQSSLQTKRFTT